MEREVDDPYMMQATYMEKHFSLRGQKRQQLGMAQDQLAEVRKNQTSRWAKKSEKLNEFLTGGEEGDGAEDGEEPSQEKIEALKARGNAIRTGGFTKEVMVKIEESQFEKQVLEADKSKPIAASKCKGPACVEKAGEAVSKAAAVSATAALKKLDDGNDTSIEPEEDETEEEAEERKLAEAQKGKHGSLSEEQHRALSHIPPPPLDPQHNTPEAR